MSENIARRITAQEAEKLTGILMNPNVPHSDLSVARKYLTEDGETLRIFFSMEDALPVQPKASSFSFRGCIVSGKLIDNIDDKIFVPLPYEVIISIEQALSQFGRR